MSEPIDIDQQLALGSQAATRILASGGARAASAAQRKGTLVAEGDSWFDYPLRDVLTVLEDRGWDVESVAHHGDNVESMAYDEAQQTSLKRVFEKVAGRAGDKPRGLLLSGGGNDFAGPELAMLLNHAASGLSPINDTITDELVNRRLVAAWAALIGFTSTLAEGLFGEKLPTFIHGYDYAVPDGRGFLGGFGSFPGPWLAPSYTRKGIDPMSDGRDLTKDLLDRYNTMLSGLASRPGLEHVTYVDLRRTLDSGAGYKDDWANELHPSRSGFEKVAAKIDAALS